MSSRHLVSAFVAGAVLGTGCSRSDSATAKAVVERTTVGDTTIVRTVSGSAWGDTARLVEELRIGALEGPDELTFGRVGQIAPKANGAVDVFDAQAFALRRFDSAGHFVRQIGARGQGPGEYEMLLGLRTLSDGRMVAYDPRNSRITTYTAAGDLLGTWPVQLPIRMFSDNAFSVDRTDHMYVLTARPGGPNMPPSGPLLLRLGPTGQIVDTMKVPQWPTSPESEGICLAPAGRWALHPSGQFISGHSASYSIDLRQASGKVLRIQRALAPVGFESGERAEIEADIAASDPPIESMSITTGKDPVIEYGPRPTLPQTKPLFRSIVAGRDGRIWVQLHARARKIDPDKETIPQPCAGERKADAPPLTWGEPTLWDVFEENGDYLGIVSVPPRTTLKVMDGDTVWAVQRGDSDEEYVVRFRLTR